MKEIWKSMTLGEKIEYLWMYFKAWFFGFLVLLGIIWLGITMYKGIHTTVLLNIAVVGGDSQKAERLEVEFAGYAKISKKDGVVRVKANIPEDSGNMESKTALTVLIGADAIDVLVCSEDVYEEHSSQDGFLSMQEVLGEEAKAYNRNVLDDGVILETDHLLSIVGMVDYEEVYVAVPVNCQNREMASQFVRYLLERV